MFSTVAAPGTVIFREASTFGRNAAKSFQMPYISVRKPKKGQPTMMIAMPKKYPVVPFHFSFRKKNLKAFRIFNIPAISSSSYVLIQYAEFKFFQCLHDTPCIILKPALKGPRSRASPNRKATLPRASSVRSKSKKIPKVTHNTPMPQRPIPIFLLSSSIDPGV